MANIVQYKKISADLSDENWPFNSFVLVWFFKMEDLEILVS